MSVRPYPRERWPKLSRQQAHASNALLRRVAAADLTRASATAHQLLGAQLHWDLLLPELCGPEALAQRLREPLVACVLERAAGGPAHTLVLECTSSTAAMLVDRTLGGDGSLGVAGAAQALDDLSQGVLAYLVARVLAVAGAGFALRSIEREAAPVHAALGHDPVLVWPLTLRVAEQSGTLRALVPCTAVSAGSRPGAAAAVPAWLGALPVTLWADGGRAVLEARCVAALEVGDVIVLDESGLASGERGFAGEIALRAVGSGWRRRCHAEGSALLMAAAHPEQEAPMTSGTRTPVPSPATPGDPSAPTVPSDRALALPGDTPIELHAELARFTVPLAELAQLGPGQVLSTGQPIGAAVTLRAAGRAIADAELVDVDGYVGVRIVRMLGG